jgi:predicted amidohydrolase YtcJ
VRVGEEVVDLGGRAVLPGLADAHIQMLARARFTLSAAHARSEDEVAQRVAAATTFSTVPNRGSRILFPC